MKDRLSFVFLGLSLRSSWGNGHATTYRALIRALEARGHRITFLERDLPWYGDNADLPDPPYCRLHVYENFDALSTRCRRVLREADVVVLGSFVPDGISVADLVLSEARGLVGFYDIDTPVTMAMLEREESEYLSAELIPKFDFYLSFSGGPCIARLHEAYGARFASSFYCMVDPALYRPTSRPKSWDLGYLGTYSADRQPTLERLLIEPARRMPDRRFVVAGPQYPADMDWPDNVTRIEHVPPNAHSPFYSSLRFALNITRAEMLRTGWSPSVRLFEAGACQTAILSDRWDGVDSIFPDRQAIKVVEGPEDVMAAIGAATDSQVAEMGRRARELVLRHHSGRNRAEQLEQIVRKARLFRETRSRANQYEEQTYVRFA